MISAALFIFFYFILARLRLNWANRFFIKGLAAYDLRKMIVVVSKTAHKVFRSWCRDNLVMMNPAT
jgi:hypothetical protein